MNRKKNNLLVISYLILFPTLSIGQVSNEKWNLKNSYTDIYSIEENYRELIRERKTKPYFQLDFTYKLNSKFDTGIYLGYSSLYHFHPDMYEITTTDEYGNEYIKQMDGYDTSNTIFYGLSENIHLLPLIFKVNNSRFDLYFVTRVGLSTENWINYTNQDTRVSLQEYKFEYSLGFGSAYYFTKKFGLYCEYNYGRFVKDNNSHLSAGLSFKF